MILKFSFEYTSTSQLVEKIIARTLKESMLDGKIVKNGDNLSLYINSESETKLVEFADLLSSELPHSIFIKSSSVVVVEEYPNDVSHESTTDSKPKSPFCPQCLKKAISLYDPFIQCEVCGYDVAKSPLVFKNFAKTIEDDNKKIFESIAFVIKNGAIVRVKTMNGFVLLGMLTENNYKKLLDGFTVLCVDLASVYKACDVSEVQALAIGSFEKPIIRTFVTMDFREKHPYIQDINIDVKMSDDLILELICQELKKIQIDYIFIAPDDSNQHSIELDFSTHINPTLPLYVSILNNKINVVLKGDRGILPFTAKTNGKIQPNLYAMTDMYTTYTNEDSINIENNKSVIVPNDIVLFKLQEENAVGSIKFQACHGAFYSVIAQNNLWKNTSIGLYCSKKYPNKIMINSPKFGLIDYMFFSFEFNSVEEIFDSLEKEDKTALTLVKNFKNRYGLSENIVFKKSQEFNGEIFLIWGAIAIMLGIYNGDDLYKAGQKVIELAQDFRGKKGPRIDYKTKAMANREVLDVLWTIRTAMSFKLTDMDNLTLCYGIVESFAEFLSKQVDHISSEHEIGAVCITGSLFESLKLLEHSYINISKNYNTCFNKELPLDEANIGFGIIYTDAQK
ncbi:MAG: hypothetical protein PHI79_01120 [Sulfurovaceae bacterium]|nr:hypothetical protein [Sulfurovaceae bacterium]MDD5548180.1 hypothetical protein [Sulfurovaceae bacterium]